MFVTKVDTKPLTDPIGYDDRILLFGSCFAEQMGKRLSEYKFSITLNPFGILFNPESIARSIELILSGRQYEASDLFYHQGLYHSYDFHSHYSQESTEKTISMLNLQVETAQKALHEANTLIVTFGSAYVYRTLESNTVVANCHKMPEKTFRRERLSVDDIAESWINLLQQLTHIKQVIFSVSPIRHLRDGLHENQLSKSTLLLAIDRIVQSDQRCVYFPAYEIVQDELRDYRYYDADMTHPSSVAVDYIWERFKYSAISPTANPLMLQCAQIQRDLAHRPIAPQSDTYQQFLNRIQEQITTILKAHPQLDFTPELNTIKKKQQE